MGAIKTTKQGTGEAYLLEITYGGAESPFGGIDASAPPAYIDPKCFTNSDGFIVVDNKLVAASWQTTVTPVLWNAVSGVFLIGFGTFYSSIYGQLNYALGYTAVELGGAPNGVAYTFYITSWNPLTPTIGTTDVLPITLFDSFLPPVAASLTLDIINSQSPINFIAGVTGHITSVDGSGGILSLTLLSGGMDWEVGMTAAIEQVSNPAGVGGTLTATAVVAGAVTAFTFTPGTGYDTTTGGGLFATEPSQTNLVINGITIGLPAYVGETYQNAIPFMVTNINAAPSTLVTASQSVDGFQLILTAITPGAAGNSITVQDTSLNGVVTEPPPFYFTPRTVRTLEGGKDQQTIEVPRMFNPSSIAEVGGTIYIGNVGPMILQYAGPGTFTTNTMYTGIKVLRKFAGSLIGLGVIPQVGIFTAATDMIFVWSAATELTEWAPVNNVGNVTGAGFAQLADIADYLVGIIVSNNTAFIIRSQGVSYATALNNGIDPYQFSHIGLGDRGEGAQIAELICQYDQVGFYIGNSNVYQITGGMQPVGDKIKSLIFALLNIPAVSTFSRIASSAASSVNLGGNTDVFATFLITRTIFTVNSSNITWGLSTINEASVGFTFKGFLGVFSNNSFINGIEAFSQSLQILARQQINQLSGDPNVPEFYTLEEGVTTTDAISPNNVVTFPIEEIVYGRQVTIDALYISLWANVSEDITVVFAFNGITFATLVLTSTQFHTVDNQTAPIELQLYPDPGIDTFTAVSPQLSIDITNAVSSDFSNLVRFSKIAIFASIDPNQRPV